MSSEKDQHSESTIDGWRKFSQEVTMHGMRYVHLKDISLVRRVIWLLLLLVCLVYCVVACYLFMDDYVKRVVSTKVQMVKADEIKFPTVTICNRNLVTLDMINYTAEALNVSDMYEILSDLYRSRSILPPPQGKYDWDSPELAGIANLTPDQTQALFQLSAHQFENTMLTCEIRGVNFPCNEVFKTVITEGGFCFQFNSDGKFNATSAGIQGGLALAIYADVMQYTMGPLSHAEGFSITLHDSDEVPQVNELSVGVRPGTQSSLILQKYQTIREPPPADDNRADCEDTKTLDNKLDFYPTYTYSGCVTECKTRYVLNKCGCRDVLQPALNNSRVCLIREMLECSTPALRTFISDESGMSACGCREACTTIEYTAHVSSFHFPSHAFILLEDIEPGVTYILEQNVVLIDLYFGKLSYQRVLEEVTYDIFDAIASIGGTLGVGIGASLLTLFEFVEFGMLQLIKLCNKRASSTRRINVAGAIGQANSVI